jgi:hypothetical protein
MAETRSAPTHVWITLILSHHLKEIHLVSRGSRIEAYGAARNLGEDKFYLYLKIIDFGSKRQDKNPLREPPGYFFNT